MTENVIPASSVLDPEELSDARAKLPDYGGTLQRDFRNPELPNNRDPAKPLRVVCWNIERGAKLPAIIKELSSLDADIICMQEVDILTGRCTTKGCSQQHAADDKQRQCTDTCAAIATALGMNSLAVAEMKLDTGGVQCNAILTKFDFVKCWALVHNSQFFDYTKPNPPGWPRKGTRVAAAAIIKSPWGDMLCYSDHFEMRCNIEGRIRQFEDLLRDAQRVEDEEKCVLQLITGDLNTYASSVAKLLPFNRQGSLWKSSFGFHSEAEVWVDAILGPGAGTSAYRKALPRLDDGKDWPSNLDPPFVDPFDPAKDSTVHALGGLWGAKLDWILCRGLKPRKWRCGNDNYSMSDHKYVLVDMVVAGQEQVDTDNTEAKNTEDA